MVGGLPGETAAGFEPPAGIDTDFVDAVGMAMATWGVPRMAGRALGVLLLAHPGALDMDAVATRLTASKGAVSPSLRLLVQLGFADRRRRLGARRDVYRAREGGATAIVAVLVSNVRALRATMTGDVAARSEAVRTWGDKLAELETLSASLLAPDR